ncbi:MAG: DUF1990 family protein [Geodermatophilaceae bacterium]
MFSLRRPSEETIQAVLSAAEAQEPAYDGVGSTAATMPKGYRRARQQLHLGHGADVFARGVQALDTWQPQLRTGITITPSDARPERGRTIVQCIRTGPLWVLAACRIVYRVDRPDRAGFAYGSLAPHPVRGEEAFLIERDAAGVVRARIVVFSRPNHWLVRLGAPVGWLVQRRRAKAYLAGIREYVQSA